MRDLGHCGDSGFGVFGRLKWGVMEKDPERRLQALTNFSRNIFILCIVFFLGAFLLSRIEFEWLVSICLAISYILLFFSWIAPGLFVLSGKPWLANVWLRGINPIAVSKTPWDQLPIAKKVLLYLYSAILFIVMIGSAMIFIDSLIK